MSLDRLTFLEKFFPQWLHWADKQGRDQGVAGDLVPREAFSSPKVISTAFAGFDDGKCTKLSQIKI